MIYVYRCGVCKHEQEEIRLIKERDDLLLCEKCGCVCKRIYKGVQLVAEQQGFYSRTMGVHPDQIQDELKRHPNWKFHPDGRLWIENLKDQRKKVKELGMTNFDDN